MDSTTHLICQQSTGQEDDWKNLYESSFPQDERMTVEEIRQLLGKGSMQLHKTLNKQNELLCFSLIFFPQSDFVLLSYIATDSTKRSGGFGSKHLKRLVEQLKAQYPNYLGLFLEIESTKEPGLTPEAKKVRDRRLSFYQRLGAKRMCKHYLWPNMTPGGGTPRQGELLWIEFGARTVDDSVLTRVIREIYERAYNLAPTDPLIQQVLAQFQTTGTGSGSTCPDPKASGGQPAANNGSTGSTGSKPAAPPSTPADGGKPAAPPPAPADGGKPGNQPSPSKPETPPPAPPPGGNKGA